MVGSWHTSLALEIGKTLVPPNMFSSRTYAFTASPAKHVGILTQFKLPLEPAWGHASFGFGIVGDWNSIDFGSGAGGPSFMFTGRMSGFAMSCTSAFTSAHASSGLPMRTLPTHCGVGSAQLAARFMP